MPPVSEAPQPRGDTSDGRLYFATGRVQQKFLGTQEMRADL